MMGFPDLSGASADGGMSSSSSATATNGDFGAAGATIGGMHIGTPRRSSTDNAIIAATAVIVVMMVALVWKK